MSAGAGSRERLDDLLCDRALEGLDAHEANELAQLVALHRGGLEDTSYDLAAAAVTLSVRGMSSRGGRGAGRGRGAVACGRSIMAARPR